LSSSFSSSSLFSTLSIDYSPSEDPSGISSELMLSPESSFSDSEALSPSTSGSSLSDDYSYSF